MVWIDRAEDDDVRQAFHAVGVLFLVKMSVPLPGAAVCACVPWSLTPAILSLVRAHFCQG